MTPLQTVDRKGSARAARCVLQLGIVLAGCLVVLAGPIIAAEKTWKAGLAKSVITPKTDVWLAGYGSRRVASEKLHELWMKALVLEDAAGHRAVLITSDFQGVPKIMSDRAFKQLEKQHGL